MHVIAGLPRSGSTLLCNILNQNPRFWATTTSALPSFVNACVNQWSNSLEVKSLLNDDRAGTEARLARTVKALCDAWHKRDDGKIVFDKSRGWNHTLIALRGAFPNSKALICVRDPRNVFASIEKQHRKTPLLDDAPNITARSIYNRAENIFVPKGLAGASIVGVEDILRRTLPAMFIKYEQLSRYPGEVMREVYNYLEEPLFIHDFDNVINTAKDPDGFYNYKFPHEGSGKVIPSNDMAWGQYLEPNLAKLILDRYPYYANRFGYR